MPDSASDGTRTPATELASDVGSLRRFNAPSEAGSASMNRTFSDQPSTRSYEESSVSAKGPSAGAGEHFGTSLREQPVSRLSAYSAPSEPIPSSSHHHDDLTSIVEHPAAHDAHIHHDASAGSERDHATVPEAAPAPLPPFSHSNTSVESASSPIMKMQPPTLATPPLRDFPANEEQNAGSDSVDASLRQHTDARPAVSPISTSRAISTSALTPVPQALQDDRPSVRRAEGQRAESEVVHSRSSSRPFKFPARSSAQFTPRERTSVLSTGEAHSKNPETLIRRLIRRASVKSNKSPSIGGAPSLVLSPSKTSVALPDELGTQEEDTNTSIPRAESLFSFRGRPYELKPQTLTQRRAKSREAGPSKIPRSSSIFAPFRQRRKRQESFGQSGLLPRDGDSAFPKDGLPLSSSSPFLTRDPDFAGFDQLSSDEDEGRTRDFVIIGRRRPPKSTAHQQQGPAGMLRSPVTTQSQETDDGADVDGSREDRTLSPTKHQTDHIVDISDPPSHGDDEPSATPRHTTFDAVDEGVESSSFSQAAVSEGHARPRPGIPRIWQGLEPVDADYSMRSTHIDDVDSSDDDDHTPPEHSLPANRFDTATTTSSFRTAVTHFDSPKSASARRLASGSKASRVSLRTLDTPLARHFDQGPRQDSPLSDLITNLERRLSARSNSGAMRSTPYHQSVASPSSELLHQDSEQTHRATAEESSPSPSVTGHNGQHYDFLDREDDDDASLHAHPHDTHLPAASHTALVETLDKSNRNSLLAPSSQASQETSEGAIGAQIRSKRDTFGGLDSIPLASLDTRQEGSRAHQTRPQLSRFSTATAGPEEDDPHPRDRLHGETSEDQEVIVPEVKVTEIESHLAAVEAALQDNRDEGSFDVTSLRQRMSSASYGMHANPSSTSVLSRDGLLQPMSVSHAANESADELSLPGAWAHDDSSFVMSDDGRRITLAPESHDALADAVRSVRRAISSSQLTDKDDSGTALAHQSVDTLGMESFLSEVADADSERRPAGDVSILSEATPARAAKRRQEGMRDIEEAYNRMLALVQSSAIGVTPSPQMRGDDGRLGFEPPRRPMKHGQAASSANEPFQNSPLAKASTKTDEPLSQAALSTRSILDTSGGGFNQPAARISTRAHPAADTRTSTSLSGLMGIPTDMNPHMLRQSSVSTATSAHDEATAEATAFRRRPLSDAKSSSSRYSLLLGRDHIASSLLNDIDGSHKRFSTDNTTVGRASSGAGHTSPSATAKTLGTPRSLNTSASQHSVANLLRRHELEKESLLDTLEIVRSENNAMHARYDRLTSDLHAEVTRVLELERELERRDSREVTLIDQIQNLESELMELRYLDFQLNSTADQTLGSEDGEGSIMDVELPPSLRSRAGVPSLPFSPRGTANPMVSPPPSFSSASISALLKPTHRSTRSEAFVAGLPGSEQATLPTSRSEMPRARPVSLLNGPGGLFRDERGSQRSSQASPLPTPRSSSLLRHPHRESNKPTQARQASPTLLGLSLPKDDSDIWNIPDEQLPEIEDEIIPTPLKRPHEQAPMLSSAGADTIDSRLGDNGHFDDGYNRNNEVEEEALSSVPSTIQPSVLSNGVTPQRVLSSSLPRSTSQATVTKSSTLSQLPRLAAASKIPTSRSVSGSSDRSVSSRLPRLGLKPSSRYTATTASGSRTVSNATDKSTGSTLSSVYSNISTGAPPSLGSLPSGNNTMEDEIQAELARLGNPKPFMRYYSPPRSKMI
ncbi:hypothetical protein PSEUBRA_004486 [Kalmanozyma brasiliensis GHG001]|uniref:uncharacterized protein n=1 Tax=Kalmanozyma brasiliensis (strain GHG001) TaxID=1365824 RepID=UPI002868026A|nr:uncharacterized protein PSEUBRA_004486 [Kalmanozyma brasiliensis GHG001]EST06576.2 hypothetical protein PSEUBRA_004486 [Kalmanozyma brasiliensis GHG001]